MPALQYLTVQDVLWINLQLTGKVQEFDYADLEEATYYQYGYGSSTSVLEQADRLLRGFLRKAPFAGENAATAVLAFFAFLELNGFGVTVTDPQATAWLVPLANGNAGEPVDVAAIAHPDHEAGSHAAGVREKVAELMVRFPETLKSMQKARETAIP